MMGISRDKRLIDVDVTIHYLLENSLFAKYIYGHPRPSRGTHRIILDITDVSAINTLTQITTLADPDTKDEWPVKCYILTKDFTVGVIKNIAPTVTTDRVWVNIERAASARS